MAIHLTDKQIGYWVEHLLQEMERAGYLKVPAQQVEIRQRLADVFIKNLNQEAALEKEARALVETHASKMPESTAFDSHKAFLMVKKQLAKDKGFVL